MVEKICRVKNFDTKRRNYKSARRIYSFFETLILFKFNAFCYVVNICLQSRVIVSRKTKGDALTSTIFKKCNIVIHNYFYTSPGDENLFSIRARKGGENARRKSRLQRRTNMLR